MGSVGRRGKAVRAGERVKVGGRRWRWGPWAKERAGSAGSRDRRRLLARLLLVLVVLPLCVGVIVAQVRAQERRKAALWRLRMAELALTQQRAAAVITALRRYSARTGGPPVSLSALTPRQLPALPDPGRASRGGWFYQSQAEGQPLGVWAIGVPLRKDFCPRCGFSFGDYFVYHSNGRYPRAAYGGILEPIGGWGYYHE
jgi:hypothetical protein